MVKIGHARSSKTNTKTGISKESDFTLSKETICELVDLAYKCNKSNKDGAIIVINTPFGKLNMDIVFKVEI